MEQWKVIKDFSNKLGLKKSIQEYIKIKRMKEVNINGRYT